MSRIYDLVILGAGPAGITAGVYAARKNLDFLIISDDIGGQAVYSSDVENYTGYQFVTGFELVQKFREHMNSFGIKANLQEKAKKIEKFEQAIKTTTSKSEYISKTLIIATGKRPKQLNVEGEKEYKNKGVTYCATCDGPLFKGKKVAVIGGGNSALDAVMQMLKLSPKIYVINMAPGLTGDKIMAEKAGKSPNVEILNNSTVKRISGDKFVRKIEIETKGRLSAVDAEGVFVEIGLIPNSDFAGEIKKNDTGEIMVDCYNKTSLEGIFAAGDVTNVPEKQIIIACGEGAKACLSAFKYLSSII